MALSTFNAAQFAPAKEYYYMELFDHLIARRSGSSTCCVSISSNRQEQFELRRQLIFSVKSVREVNSSDSAISVDLHSKIDKTLFAYLRVSM